MRRTLCTLGAGIALAAGSAKADDPVVIADVRTMDSVTVNAHYDNRVGTSDAASEGVITPQLIADRPLLRPGNLLEYVPGMVVTQHSGAGLLCSLTQRSCSRTA